MVKITRSHPVRKVSHPGLFHLVLLLVMMASASFTTLSPSPLVSSLTIAIQGWMQKFPIKTKIKSTHITSVAQRGKTQDIRLTVSNASSSSSSTPIVSRRSSCRARIFCSEKKLDKSYSVMIISLTQQPDRNEHHHVKRPL